MDKYAGQQLINKYNCMYLFSMTWVLQDFHQWRRKLWG